MFYGVNGDNIGVIVVCWYGVMYGYYGVLEGNFKVLIFKCYVIFKFVEYLFFWIYNVGFFFRMLNIMVGWLNKVVYCMNWCMGFMMKRMWV